MSIHAMLLALFTAVLPSAVSQADATGCHADNEIHHRAEVERCREAHAANLNLERDGKCEAYLDNCEHGWQKACVALSDCFASRRQYEAHQRCLDTERVRYQAQSEQCRRR
jgi:hypothetical protein